VDKWAAKRRFNAHSYRHRVFKSLSRESVKADSLNQRRQVLSIDVGELKERLSAGTKVRDARQLG